MKKLISFVGIGHPRDGYQYATYCFDDGFNFKTKLVQLAIAAHEVAIHKAPFDAVFLLMTTESKKRYLHELMEGFGYYGILSDHVKIFDGIDTSKQDADSQWKWFSTLCSEIQDTDEIVFDFTHGFRSVPIIFATAIHFFQTISNFNLLHAYYGFIETSNGIQDENRGRFVDLAQFFDLNRWATASAFFARSADASMFSELMRNNATPGLFTFLQESGLSNTMEALSSIIKDVDVHHASDKAFEAVKILESKEGRLEAPEKLVLDKICSVFKRLSAYSARHNYDACYLRAQIELCKILINHELYMQAFTAMRELIGSIGMAALTGEYRERFDSSDGLTKHRRLADLFIRYFQHATPKFSEDERARIEKHFAHFFQRLAEYQLDEPLRCITQEITTIRNGFDHAWTEKRYQGKAMIASKANNCFETLERIITTIIDNHVLEDDVKGEP